MKKLIAISVVFALVAGAAFAVDVGAHVFGTANVLQGDTGKDANGDSHKVTSGGKMNRVRIDGSGEANENFGGYFRFDRHHWDGGLALTGNAWWKPIDQFKLLIGGNDGDGFIGKEGNTGWMFYQTATDVDVTFGGDNVWGGSIYGYGLTTRYAFYEQGDGQHDVYLFITPMDMLAINIIFPFISHAGEETADVFKQTIAQIDFKMEGIGNIALTYAGGRGHKDPEISSDYVAGTDTKGATVFKGSDGKDYILGAGGVATEVVGPTGTYKEGYDEPSSIFLYYGGTFGDLSIDFGLGYHMAVKVADKNVNQPLGIGLGVKYAMETLGVKFRTAVAFPMDESQGMQVLVDVLPYFTLADNMTAFVSVGLGMRMLSKLEKDAGGDASGATGWHFNPYLQVGEEWGAKFLFGIKAWSNGEKQGDGSKVTSWAVPVALMVNF